MLEWRQRTDTMKSPGAQVQQLSQAYQAKVTTLLLVSVCPLRCLTDVMVKFLEATPLT